MRRVPVFDGTLLVCATLSCASAIVLMLIRVVNSSDHSFCMFPPCVQVGKIYLFDQRVVNQLSFAFLPMHLGVYMPAGIRRRIVTERRRAISRENVTSLLLDLHRFPRKVTG